MNIQHTSTDRGGKFFLGDPGSPTAELVYRMAGLHKMIIDHTEVTAVHKGEGIGKQLVAEAVNFAREHQLKIFPLCPFARAILEKTPEYADILAAPANN
jgi:predicted GNAT family acetyltransferase